MLVVPRILNQQLLSFLACLIPLCALGQVPSASITPYEASTTLSGAASASREFQLIDADGTVVTQAVEWRIEPSEFAQSNFDNGVLTVEIRHQGAYEITAYYQGQKYVAHHNVFEKQAPDEVAPWKITPLNGRFSDKVESVKVDETTPYYYFEDSGARGVLIRAFTYEGTQKWVWPAIAEPARIQLLCADNLGGFLVFVEEREGRFLVSVDEKGEERWRRSSTGSKDAYTLTWGGIFFLVETDLKSHRSNIVGIDQNTGEQKFDVAAPTSEEITLSGRDCKSVLFRKSLRTQHTGFFSEDGYRVEIVFFPHSSVSVPPNCKAGVSQNSNEHRIDFVTISSDDGSSKIATIQKAVLETGQSWGTTGMLIPDGHDGILISFRSACKAPCHSRSSIMRVSPEGRKLFELALPEFGGKTTDGMLLGGNNAKDPSFMGFVSHGPYVIAFEVPSGKEAWRWKSTESVELRYALRDGGVLAVSDSATYHVVNGKLEDLLPRDWVLFNMH